MTRLSELSRSVAGKVVLVTGAASGMGRATARLFADEGARVAVSDVDEPGAKAVAEEIVAAGGDARAWRLDVGDPARIEAVVAEVARDLGGLDVLINNAGIPAGVAVDAPEYEELWERALRILLTAQVRLVRAALPHLERSGEGRVVNVASSEGLGATPGMSPYSTAKHGVVGLTRSLAVELGPRGVTVNCICPGPIRTGMTAPIPDAAKEKFARRRVPLRRYGTPEEVAHAILAFALPAASYLNGAVLPVDGGMTAKGD